MRRVTGMKRLTTLVAALVALVGIAASTQAKTVTDEGPGVESQQFTGVAATVLTHPSAVRGTDGRLHIAYEVVLTDTTPFGIDVKRVDVRDARPHRVLQSFAGRPSPLG
jgi:hypothetical protein